MLGRANASRLLRTTVRRGDDGTEERSVSLGHDALARVAFPWKQELARRRQLVPLALGAAAGLAVTALFAFLTLRLFVPRPVAGGGRRRGARPRPGKPSSRARKTAHKTPGMMPSKEQGSSQMPGTMRRRSAAWPRSGCTTPTWRSPAAWESHKHRAPRRVCSAAHDPQKTSRKRPPWLRVVLLEPPPRREIEAPEGPHAAS